MSPERLDQILAREQELAPSSGFLAGVMERVREEAAAPPPIAFPWKRAVPGFLLLAGVLIWAAVVFAHPLVSALRSMRLNTIVPSAPLFAVSKSSTDPNALWVAVVLVACLFAWLLGRRLIGRRRSYY